MDFNLNDEQNMIAGTAAKIASRFGPDYWYEKEEKHEFPHEFYDELGGAGFLGFLIPREFGGGGMGLTETAIAVRELCRGGGGAGPMMLYLLGIIFGGASVVRHGSDEQKAGYLPLIASGKMRACLGLTEPDAGTDTLNIRTFAQNKGDEYVINGSKMFITGIEDAGLLVLVTRTEKPDPSSNKARGLTLFAVDLPSPAIHHTQIAKHGFCYLKTYELGIEDLRVPASSILGEEGKGWYHILDTLNPERIITAAGAVGTGNICIDKAVEYARGRKVFDNFIGAYQGIQFPLASAHAKLECAWLAVLKAADLYDRNRSAKQVGDAANMAKYAAVEAAMEAGYHAVQTLGGYGFAREYHVERWWRELQLLRLAPVTQQMTLNYIAQHVLGLPKSY